MASSLATKKILVVDDNQIILNVLSSALKSRGYEVFTAVDGPAAFTVVLQEQPDLILLDIFFPPDIFQSGNTWDGFLIMHWLQRMGGPRANRTPVIVMSGAEPVEIKDRCLAAGAVDYFQKPVKIPELLDAIQQLSRPRVSEVPLEVAAMSNSEQLRL
ncbi:MAG: response regulator [Verrucomicrobiota bacterium]|jgi:CheY-like chemotaxis protein